jgi:hypothetical protein
VSRDGTLRWKARSIGSFGRQTAHCPRLHHSFGGFANPPNVFHTIGIGESNIAVATAADAVASVHDCVRIACVTPFRDEVSDGRLAGTRRRLPMFYFAASRASQERQ